MKRATLSVLLVLVVMAAFVSVVYAQPREEIRLTTIIPDQQVLRVKKGIISTAKYRQADFPDNLIPANSLIIAEGNVGIGTTNPQASLHIGGTPGPTNGIKFPDGSIQTIAADAPAYDSGWFYADSSYNNTVTLNHNLNYIPTRIHMFAADSSNPTWVRPLPLQSQGVGYWAPESFWLSKTQAMIVLCYADSIIYCDANNPCPAGITTSQKGYLRVLLWK